MFFKQIKPWKEEVDKVVNECPWKNLLVKLLARLLVSLSNHAIVAWRCLVTYCLHAVQACQRHSVRCAICKLLKPCCCSVCKCFCWQAQVVIRTCVSSVSMLLECWGLEQRLCISMNAIDIADTCSTYLASAAFMIWTNRETNTTPFGVDFMRSQLVHRAAQDIPALHRL